MNRSSKFRHTLNRSLVSCVSSQNVTKRDQLVTNNLFLFESSSNDKAYRFLIYENTKLTRLHHNMNGNTNHAIDTTCFMEFLHGIRSLSAYLRINFGNQRSLKSSFIL